MPQLAKFLLVLALVVPAVGALAAAGAPGQTSGQKLARGLERVIAAARLNPEIQALAAGALGCGALALVAGVRKRRCASLPVPEPRVAAAADPLVDPAAVREAILQLAGQIRPLIERADADVVGLVDALTAGAVRLGASDIHYQPLETGTQVYFRVGGVLEDVLSLPAALHPRLATRYKVLARLVTYVSDRPQDGHYAFEAGRRPTDLRVSLLPTNHGEKVVVRIARGRVELPELASLGFPADAQARLKSLLRRPQGLVFLTGPTGSGKTTTIYAALGHIKRERGDTTQIATIEDPIEFEVPFLTQTQVRPDAGLSFAQGLRAMLRQDPNVMMVGEIRDSETARIAIQAGLSGHLILTTVHAESAAGTFNRLIEMGVEPFLLSSASLASVSQRLARRLCPHCRREASPTPAQRERLEKLAQRAERCFEPKGCPRCGGRGYLGRTALVEVLEVSPAIGELINARTPTPGIAEQAGREGMRRLIEDGLAKAEAGETSLDEVLRVAG